MFSLDRPQIRYTVLSTHSTGVWLHTALVGLSSPCKSLAAPQCQQVPTPHPSPAALCDVVSTSLSNPSPLRDLPQSHNELRHHIPPPNPLGPSSFCFQNIFPSQSPLNFNNHEFPSPIVHFESSTTIPTPPQNAQSHWKNRLSHTLLHAL